METRITELERKMELLIASNERQTANFIAYIEKNNIVNQEMLNIITNLNNNK